MVINGTKIMHKTITESTSAVNMHNGYKFFKIPLNIGSWLLKSASDNSSFFLNAICHIPVPVQSVSHRVRPHQYITSRLFRKKKTL